EAGRRRLAFDELFDQQLVQARARALAKRARAGISFALKKALTTKLKTHLPFELTGDQRQAIREITDDMLAPLRMHRLLMGDVGTGKTVVALFAMLLAVENDYQAAIMAPTELLAEQHLATLTRLLEHPALPRAHAVRRPGRDPAARASPGPRDGEDGASHRGGAPEDLRLHPGGVRGRPAGIRDLSGDRRIGAGRPEGCDRDGGASGQGVSGARGRPGARAAQGGGARRDDAGVP